MNKLTLLILTFSAFLLSCSSEPTTYEITEIGAVLELPGEPEVTTNGDFTNIRYANEQFIYCIEFQKFSEPTSIEKLYETHFWLNEFDSEIQANCIASKKTVFGMDTTNYEVMAGLLIFKNEQTQLVSTSYHHLTSNWRVSIELGMLNLELTPEQRKEIRNNLFSIEPFKFMYDDLSERVHKNLETYNVDSMWR